MAKDYVRDQFTEYLRAFKQRVPAGAPSLALLLVHGFNVSYPEAAKAAARLAFNVRVNLVPIVVSWPSQAAMLKYWNDEQNVEPSIERLRPVVQFLLSHPDIDELVVVSHSMGSRLVTRVWPS